MADSKLSALTEISVPALADELYMGDVSPSAISNKVTAQRALGLLPFVCNGRLTLTSNTPVTTADVTGATSIYFTPYMGDRIAIYDGTRWILYAFTELTLALGTLTSGLPYDVFIYDNAGTLTLELLAWTNGTTRATAVVLQNGVLCKSGALTRRLLGTFYTTSTTATEDSETNRYLANVYNRELRSLQGGATGSHTYATAAARNWNDGTTTQIACVCAIASGIQLGVSGDTNGTAFLMIGVDGSASFNQRTHVNGSASWSGNSRGFELAVGRHTFVVQEYGGSGTLTEAYSAGVILL